MRYDDYNMYEYEEEPRPRLRPVLYALVMLITRRKWTEGKPYWGSWGYWFWSQLFEYVMKRWGYSEYGYRNPHDWDCVDWTTGQGTFAGFHISEGDSRHWYQLWRFRLTKAEDGTYLSVWNGHQWVGVSWYFTRRYWKKRADYLRRKYRLRWYLRVKSGWSRKKTNELLNDLPF